MPRQRKPSKKDKKKIQNLLTHVERSIKNADHSSIQQWAEWFTTQDMFDFQQAYAEAIMTFPGVNALTPETGNDNGHVQKTNADDTTTEE